jgi:hypothetical protein
MCVTKICCRYFLGALVSYPDHFSFTPHSSYSDPGCIQIGSQVVSVRPELGAGLKSSLYTDCYRY